MSPSLSFRSYFPTDGSFRDGLGGWSLLLTSLVPTSVVDQSSWPGIVQVLSHVVPILVVLSAQVYRYRSVSSQEQRLQIKWVLLGLGICLVGVTLLGLGYGLIPGANVRGSLYDVAGYWDFPLVTTAIPVSIGIAMLYSRLWDVDRVINHALVYGTLTLSLGALYLGGVIALQALARAITGQGSDLAVAVVTLAIAALFNPWR